MEFHASFSWWSPEIYVRIGPAAFYASLWKAALLAGTLILLKQLAGLRRAGLAESKAFSNRRALMFLVAFAYLLSIMWPFGAQREGWLPWANPPSYIEIDGMPFGKGPYEGAPDPRVDTYGCQPRASLDDYELVRVGHLGGIFGGPALFMDQGVAPTLVVRPTEDCWIIYPEWI